jgi:hypothetical protein
MSEKMPRNSPFDQLITEAEIQTLRSLKTAMRVHPLVSVALHPGTGQYPDQIAANTCRALGNIIGVFDPWLQNLRPRLLDQQDWTASESALAEIRACGSLLGAGYPVVLGGKNTNTGAKPEFHITLDGVETIVEVWNRNRPANFVSGSGTVTPFGAPDPAKPGDSVLTNVIQRVAGIKDREHQAADAQPFVVWADLQSVDTMRFDYSDHLAPLMNDRGRLESGGYWHGLYGCKGDPLFEIGSAKIASMLHDGRYYATMKHGKKTRLSGVFFASPRTTAFMEHPEPINPVPNGFRKLLINVDRFEMGVSLANWTDGLVAQTVEVQRRTIAGVAQALRTP